MSTQPTGIEESFWRPGDPVGERRFVEVGRFETERAGVLPSVVVAYECWGTLSATGDNAILVEHALTGDSHVIGDASPGHPTPGWWPGLIGPGAPLDTDRFFVVAMNVLGGCQGTTGPSSLAPDGRPWGSRFPYLTIRDQVAAERAVADALGIASWRSVLGGSMGGMRALEWAISYPDRVDSAIVIASTAAATADQLAWCQPQILAITADPNWHDGDYYNTGRRPDAGLGIARRIAHTTYRSELELDQRFGREAAPGPNPLGDGGRFQVESYLDHHASKIVRRFDAGSYVSLTRAMNSHDIGRDRGGVAEALSRFEGHLVVAGVTSDRCFPLRLSQDMVTARPGTELTIIDSPHGHDGFLIETEQVGALITSTLQARRAAVE